MIVSALDSKSNAPGLGRRRKLPSVRIATRYAFAYDPHVLLTQLFLNPQTKMLRSGWRALAFASVLYLPQWLLSDHSETEPAPVGTAFPVNAGIIFSYALMVFWVGLVSWLCLHFLERLKLAALGFSLHRGWWRDALLGFGLSSGMILLIVALQAIGGGTRISLPPDWWQNGALNASGLWLTTRSLLAALLLLLLAGALEELMYRGYAFQTLLRSFPAAPALLFFSLLFGLGHWNNPSRTVFSTANTILAGIWLSVAYLKTRSLWFPTMLHVGWNWTMGAVFGLPVSGLRIPEHPLLTSTSTAPLWLTGGGYGCEGGAAATVVLLLAILLIWRARWLQVAPEIAAVWSPAPAAEPPIGLQLNRD